MTESEHHGGLLNDQSAVTSSNPMNADDSEPGALRGHYNKSIVQIRRGVNNMEQQGLLVPRILRFAVCMELYPKKLLLAPNHMPMAILISSWCGVISLLILLSGSAPFCRGDTAD